MELFIAMLKERPEIVDMDVGDNGEVMVTLSLESIIEHDLSKMRVLTQDDVEIMYAKHILFNHDEGGETVRSAPATSVRSTGMRSTSTAVTISLWRSVTTSWRTPRKLCALASASTLVWI